MYAPQDEGGAGLAGHGRYDVRHLPQHVAVDHDLLGGGRIVAPLQIFLRLDRDDPGSADVADD